MNTLEIVTSPDAPEAIGPYSQSVKAGDYLFVSGQIPLDPKTGRVVEGGIKEQTRRALENIKAILTTAGIDLSHVVKAEIFLKNMDHFQEMNDVYAEYFRDEKRPARQAVEVARLPKDVLIEISCIGYLR